MVKMYNYLVPRSPHPFHNIPTQTVVLPADHIAKTFEWVYMGYGYQLVFTSSFVFGCREFRAAYNFTEANVRQGDMQEKIKTAYLEHLLRLLKATSELTLEQIRW